MGRKHKLNKLEMQEHLLSKVIKDPVTGCWNWTGKKNQYHTPDWSYGMLHVDGKLRMATAVAVWAFGDNKEIITGHGGNSLYHCHTCDNPLCINPKHIFLGTQLVNIQDSVKKRRHWAHSMTACKRGHPFTKENTYLLHGHFRVCRTCKRDGQRERLGQTPDTWRLPA